LTVAIHALRATRALGITWARRAISINTTLALGARRVRAFIRGAVGAGTVNAAQLVAAVPGLAVGASLAIPVNATFALGARLVRAIRVWARNAVAVNTTLALAARFVWASLGRAGFAHASDAALTRAAGA
jgi:hypothetical protein